MGGRARSRWLYIAFSALMIERETDMTVKQGCLGAVLSRERKLWPKEVMQLNQ